MENEPLKSSISETTNRVEAIDYTPVLIKLKRQKLYSLYFLLGGISFTVITYLINIGNSYFIFYGPIIFGIYDLVKSFTEENKLKKAGHIFPNSGAYKPKDLWILLSFAIVTFLSLATLAYSFVTAENWTLIYDIKEDRYMYIEGFSSQDACKNEGAKHHSTGFICGKDCISGDNCKNEFVGNKW